MSDRSAEDFARSSSDLQSQDGLHQHPGRRAAGGDAVSDAAPIKGFQQLCQFLLQGTLCSERGNCPNFRNNFTIMSEVEKELLVSALFLHAGFTDNVTGVQIGLHTRSSGYSFLF